MPKTTLNELIEGALEDPVFNAEYAKDRVRRAITDVLFKLRKAANLTQSALAEKAGWKQPYVARIERGDSNMVAAMEGLERFANATGTSTVVLFIDPDKASVRAGVALGEQPRIQEIARALEKVSSTALEASRVAAADLNAVDLALDEVNVAALQLHRAAEGLKQRSLAPAAAITE